MATSHIHWLSRGELPDSGRSVFLGDWFARLLHEVAHARSISEFLQQQLVELNAEYSAQGSALWRRTPEWTCVAHSGRRVPSESVREVMEEVLDREEAFVGPREDGTLWMVFPVFVSDDSPATLVFSGKGADTDRAAELWGACRTLAEAAQLCEQRLSERAHAERLRQTLDVAAKFVRVENTEALLHVIAEEATRLLDCDRASIFLWDKAQAEVVAVPALGVDGETLRIPDNRGIVGEVIQSVKTIVVDDAYADPRFNQNVDKASGYKTRTLLCSPLKDGAGTLIGAFEVINKNGNDRFSPEDTEILSLLGIQAANALHKSREREDLLRTRQNLTDQVVRGVEIVGESQPIVALRDTIGRLAPTDLPVLILGESGTGKEVVSQALHYRGPRKDRPFIAVNCAALAETLLESELFGHEKGAFTDAHEARHGKFELADGGTLFLDEIGDMSPGGQAKLLRVLEQKIVTRVGGSTPIPINVRVIAATNSNLAEKVKQSRFRQDLYYRLSVVTIDIPPLRDRPEDILPLAEHFLKQFCRQANRPPLVLSMDARRRLQSHHWPGNIRELRNLMERVAFLTSGARVEVEDLAFILSPEMQSMGLVPSEELPLDDATKQFQRDFIRRAIKRVQENMSEAARLLGVHRSNLYRKMKQLEMREVGGEE